MEYTLITAGIACAIIALIADKCRDLSARNRRLREYLAEAELKTRLLCNHVNSVNKRRNAE